MCCSSFQCAFVCVSMFENALFQIKKKTKLSEFHVFPGICVHQMQAITDNDVDDEVFLYFSILDYAVKSETKTIVSPQLPMSHA